MMKKIVYLLTAMLFSVMTFAQSYGILVNGHTYYEGTLVDEFEGFTQYLAHVEVSAGDYCQLYDKDHEAAWAVTLNTASVDGFSLNNDRYDISADGCYDFYIKLKYQADELYIGNGTDCGDGEEISGGGGGDPQPGGGAKDYYLKGYCNGVDIEQPTYDELFENGILEYTFTGDAYNMGYFFILVCDKGQKVGVGYMTTEFVSGVTHATLTKDGQQKFGVPEGSVTFYLYDNEDGTFELSTEELPGKKLVDSDEESALDEVQTIDTESPMFNILGEAVDATYHGIVIQNGRKYLR